MSFDLTFNVIDILLVVGLILVLCFTYYTTVGAMSYLEELDGRVAEAECDICSLQRRFRLNLENPATRTEIPLEAKIPQGTTDLSCDTK